MVYCTYYQKNTVGDHRDIYLPEKKQRKLNFLIKTQKSMPDMKKIETEKPKSYQEQVCLSMSFATCEEDALSVTLARSVSRVTILQF